MDGSFQDRSGVEEETSRGFWSNLEQVVERERKPTVDLWETLRERLDLSKKKPKRIASVEVVGQQTARGEVYYVLHNVEANTYLQVDARDYFLWGLLDGEHSIRDLAVAYFVQFGAFPFDRLVHLLGQLKMNYFLAEKPVHVFSTVAKQLAARTLAYRLKRFSETFTQKEFSLKNADRFFNALYQRVGWLFFTRPALILYAVLTVVGLALFVWELQTGTYPLLITAGSYGLGLIALMLLNYVMLFFHESGHALTCKSLGRAVPKAGVLLYFGSLSWFVDTTDIWLLPKRSRIAVSLAGPSATVILGSLLATVIALFPAFPLNPTLFQAAFMGYLSALLNMTPFIEYDGYYVLMDWLEIPMLRKKALAFVREKLLDKVVKERSKFSREETIFTVFGLLAAAWSGFMLLFAVYLWQSRVSAMIAALLSGQDLLSTFLAGGLVIIAGVPIILGLSIKALLWASETVARACLFVRTRPAGKS